MAEEKKQTPSAVAQAGCMRAVVWRNKGEDGTVYPTVELIRKYKDKEGNWKDSKTLRTNDIPKAVLVLSKIYEGITMGDRFGFRPT